jgi:aminopeptidase N
MIHRSVTLLAALSLLSIAALFAQDAPHARYAFHEDTVPREHVVDMQRTIVDVRFEPQAGKVIGKATHMFSVLRDRVDSIFFDGPGIAIGTATLNGRPLKYRTVPQGIWTYPGSPLVHAEKGTIVFDYTARPEKGIYFIGWNDPRNMARKQIWTQGQAIDNRYWIPCYDNPNDKLITETIVTMPKPFKVLSNGTKLGEKENADGSVTWHYTMTHPHSIYLLMLGIGEYAVEERKTKAGVPVHLWYYPDQADRVKATYRYSTECIDFVAEHVGIPFPWESYSQIPVADYLYGAMENTTATVFGDFFNVDARGALDRTYVEVNVHELVHQWFGDLVTARNFNDNWLQESFATFYPQLFTRKFLGEDTYEWKRRGHHNAALAAGEKDDLPVSSSIGGSARHYPKGASVLDMMMYVFGEEQYRRVIQHYVRKHAYGNVETNDLYQSFQDTLGLSPDWFFDQWIRRGGEPHYEVAWQDAVVKGMHTTRISVGQVQALNHLVRYFRMPVDLEVHYTDGSSAKGQEVVDNELTIVDVPNPAGKTVAFVLFDPASRILKRLTFKKTFVELKAQALKAPHMIDRYDAIVALRDSSLDQKRALLIEVFGKETFHGVKGEVLNQLAKDTHAEAQALVKRAMGDKDVEVRRAAIKSLDQVPETLRPSVEVMLQDSSYEVLRTALEKLCRSYPANTKRYLDATAGIQGLDGQVRTKWLEIAANNGDRQALEQLSDLTTISYEFRTRQNAMQALKALGHCDPTVADRLLDAAISYNRRLAAVAVDVLKDLRGRTAYRGLLDDKYRTGVWDDRERKVLKEVFE